MAHIHGSLRRARGGVCEAMDMKTVIIQSYHLSRQITDPLTAIIGITFDRRSQQILT